MEEPWFLSETDANLSTFNPCLHSKSRIVVNQKRTDNKLKKTTNDLSFDI